MGFSDCYLVYECSFGKRQESECVPLFCSSTDAFDKDLELTLYFNEK